jgi:beta-lysine 5,6-aminomutase beta subunit
VGIDAIMNMKGYAGRYGLERYDMIETLNLGSQVENEDFIREAVHYQADVMLVSQTVTQKDVHIKNISKLVELLEAESLRDKFLLIIGGPRLTHELAKELGGDAGFGPGKYADDVAAYMVTELARRQESKSPIRKKEEEE